MWGGVRDALQELVPGIDILHGWIDCLATRQLLLQEALQLEERRGKQDILDVWQPAVMQCVDLQLEQFFLLVGELRDPRVLVEFRGGRCTLLGLWRAEE